MFMKETNLPTREECIRIFDEHKVPDDVRQHCRKVNQVAVFLAKKLKEKGVDIDIDLVDRGSLLHDLDKIPTLGKGNHGEETFRIMCDKGFHRIGYLARRHLTHYIFYEESTWEDKIVNYADKRCQNDRIVPLKERFAYIRSKYDLSKDKLYIKAEKEMLKFEKMLFEMIGLDPEKLNKYVD